METLVRFVVDNYHHREHRGLERASPANTWTRLCHEHGWSPPVDRHQLRHILGIRLERHDLLVCGVNYHSEPLARHFMHAGGQMLDVRLDAEDMGHVSAWFGDAWHSVPAVIGNMDGVAVAT